MLQQLFFASLDMLIILQRMPITTSLKKKYFITFKYDTQKYFLRGENSSFTVEMSLLWFS